MLLFLTYLHEETGKYEKEIKLFYKHVQKFRKNEWIESNNKDFIQLPADYFDNPIPSSVSLAELAILRSDILMKRLYGISKFKEPLSHDFLNISTLVRNGFFHVIESPKKNEWKKLPGNTIQVRGEDQKDCYKRACRPLNKSWVK